MTVQFFFDGPKPDPPNPDPFQAFLDILGNCEAAGSFTPGLRQMSYTKLDEMMSHVHDFTPQESLDEPCSVKLSNGVKPDSGSVEMIAHVHDILPRESLEVPCPARLSNGIKPELETINYTDRKTIVRSRFFADQQHHTTTGMGMLHARCVICDPLA